MEARRLGDPSLLLVHDKQVHYPLLSFSICRDFRLAHHALTHPVVTIGLVGDIGLRQDHEVESANIYHPDGLRDPEPLSIANVEVTNG